MRRIFFLLLVVACGWVFKGCKPMPNDGIPVYLTIDSVVLNDNGNQAGNTHKILDVWAEENSTNLGVYEMPVQIPILDKGELRFVISAGVLENGISNSRVKYPFYLADTFTIPNAQLGEKYTHVPTFAYRPATNFVLLEDFETSNGFYNIDPLFADSNVAFGGRCGHIILPATDSSKQATAIIPHDLNEGQEIWVEINYKSNVPFYVGMNGLFNSGTVIRVPKLFVNAKGSWNKLYIKFSNEIGALVADNYTLYFEALRPYGQTGQGDVYLDNIKIVQF